MTKTGAEGRNVQSDPMTHASVFKKITDWENVSSIMQNIYKKTVIFYFYVIVTLNRNKKYLICKKVGSFIM